MLGLGLSLKNYKSSAQQMTDIVLFSTTFPTSSLTSGFIVSSAIDIIIDNDATYIPNSSGYTGSSGNYKIVFTDQFEGGATAILTYNTPISTLGKENIRVTFGCFDINTTGSGLLEYSVNGGGAWINAGNFGTNPWELSEHTLGASANNKSDLRLRWSYPTSGLGDFIGIDDINTIGDLII